MAIKLVGQTFCHLTMRQLIAPLAIHRRLEILTFQMKSCMVLLSTCCSLGKMMTTAAQLQIIFLNFHRVWFEWIGCLCMESIWWVFQRHVYIFSLFPHQQRYAKKSHSKVSYLGQCFLFLASSVSWSNVRGMWFLGQGMHAPVTKVATQDSSFHSSLLPLCSWLFPDL